MGTLDDVQKGSDELLTSYYSLFNKNLADIDPVIFDVEVIRSFMRDLGPKGIALKDSHQVILLYNPEELTERVKSYIDL